MRPERRRLLARGLGLAAAASAAAAGAQPAAPTADGTGWREGTKLVLLGTMAGPVLDAARAMCSQLVVVDGHGYLVDCGYGAVMRMTEIGFRLPSLRQVFVTHHHSDHTADYPALANLAWILGIRGRLGVHGPAPMRQVHEAALAVFAEDAAIRIRATGRQPPEASFDVREIAEPGVVFEDERVKVTAALVDHPPFKVALAYRFDTATRSIVISGDTAPSPSLVALAKGADVLVHEAMVVQAIDGMLARRPYVPPNLRQFLLGGHTSAEDVGRIAAEAGVKTLVLSHLLPGDEPVADASWLVPVRRAFDGAVVLGRDRMVI